MSYKQIRISNNFVITQRRHTKKQRKRGKGHRYYTIDLVEWFPDDELEEIRKVIDPKNIFGDADGLRYTFKDLDTAQKRFNMLMLSNYDIEL